MRARELRALTDDDLRYTQIFATNGAIWQWYGRMAHNAFAIRNPTTNQLSARFRVFFGDAVTGSQEAYANYDDDVVELPLTVDPVRLVTPVRGGGIDTNLPPMIHVDIFYDYATNQMHATVDTTAAIPKLFPLPPGCAFDTRSNYSVLNGAAYNFQYAWNLGALFSPPTGAAVWIERLSASPGLENYEITVLPDVTITATTAGNGIAASYFNSQRPDSAHLSSVSCGRHQGRPACYVTAQVQSAGYLFPARWVTVRAIGYLAHGVTREDQ